jgi:3-deoxy-alpha-D-manno-octulosonate 8-oxidase
MFRVFKQVPRILFGKGSINKIDELIPDDKKEYILYLVDDSLNKPSILTNSDHGIINFPAFLGEPKTNQVDQICKKLKIEKTLPTTIVGIGGGSTMDMAKSISIMLCNDGSSANYQGWDLVPNPGLYKIGVPTISGSGAEASRTAVLMGPEKKFGINSDHSMFDAIILDSDLTKTVPKEQQFHTAMDCYIHCVESIEGTMINDLSKSYATKALELCTKSYLEEYDADEMMVASFFGGVSIVNSEVGICHALSYGLSLELGFRHGIANCIAFNVLNEYYGNYVENFHRMLKKYKINLPKNICNGQDEKSLSRMVDMTLKMERPLTNALGTNWRNIMTTEKITELYLKM